MSRKKPPASSDKAPASPPAAKPKSKPAPGQKTAKREAKGKLAAAREIEIATRRADALKYRQWGMSYRAIAKKLDISHAQAARDVNDALRALNDEVKEEAALLKILVVERINMARLAIAEAVTYGDLKALDRWIRLNEQEIKLYGLDAPQKIEFIDSETALLMEQLGIKLDDLKANLKRLLQEKAQNG